MYKFSWRGDPVATQHKIALHLKCPKIQYLNDFNGIVGAPKRIRTSDPQIRSLMLYPAELWARIVSILTSVRASPLKQGSH